MTVAAGAATAPSGAARLRRWDVPYGEATRPSSTRPVRPSPRDCGKLIERCRIVKQQTSWKNTGSANTKISALTLDELISEQPDSGIVLDTELTDRFYGGLKGTTMEDEILRLGTLVKGILRDFTVVKDVLFRSEDAFSVQNDRIAVLENESEQLMAHVDQLPAPDQLTSLVEKGQLASPVEKGRLDDLDARLLAHQEDIDRRLRLLGAIDAPMLIPLTPLVDTGDAAATGRQSVSTVDERRPDSSATTIARCCDSVDLATTRPASTMSADFASNGAMIVAMRKELDDLAGRVKAIDAQVASQKESSTRVVESAQSGLFSVTASAIVDRALAETAVTPPTLSANLRVAQSLGAPSEDASPRDVDVVSVGASPAIGSRSVSPLVSAAAGSIVDSLLADAVCRPLGQRPRTAPPHKQQMKPVSRPSSAPSAQRRPLSAGLPGRPSSAGRSNFGTVPEDEGYIQEDTADDGVDDEFLYEHGGSASCELGARQDDFVCLHWMTCDHRPQSAPTYNTRSLDVRSPAEIIRDALEDAAQRGDLSAWLEDLALADDVGEAAAPSNDAH